MSAVCPACEGVGKVHNAYASQGVFAVHLVVAATAWAQIRGRASMLACCCATCGPGRSGRCMASMKGCTARLGVTDGRGVFIA